MPTPIKANTNMVLFHLGPIQIPVYGFLVVMGFLVAVGFAFIEWKKKEYRNWDFVNILLIGGFLSLFGARWLYILFNPVETFKPIFENNDSDITLNILLTLFDIKGGRTILGSILLLTTFLYLYPKYLSPDVQWEDTFNIILPNIFISQAIGRWGNFADHNLYGQIIDGNNLWWLTSFLKDNMYINDGIIGYRQPLFLYESLADLAAFILLTGLKFNKKIKPGSLGGLYIWIYGLIRITIEPFRDVAFKMMWGPLDMAIVVSLIMIILGTSIFIYTQFYHIYHKISV